MTSHPAPAQLRGPIAAVGDVVAGKYQVQRLLGRGGMGLVMAAMHVQLQEPVALKILLPSKAIEPGNRARFLREARVTARLHNEHIAQVMDIGILDSGAPYFVMEYLEGIDLKRLLAQHGPLEVPVAVNFVAQACEGIAEAHANRVWHRDLKPSNLFLTARFDGTDLIKVLDFGVSKACMPGKDDSYATAAGEILGSPAYMSPERLEPETDTVDARSDVWSLAVILYELLAGRPPVWNENPALLVAAVFAGKPYVPLRATRPGVPAALDDAIARALRFNPADRTPDVAAFVSDILSAVPEAQKIAGVSAERVRAALDRSPASGDLAPASGLARHYIGARARESEEVYSDHSTIHERKAIEGPAPPASPPIPAIPAQAPNRARPVLVLSLVAVVAIVLLVASGAIAAFLALR